MSDEQQGEEKFTKTGDVKVVLVVEDSELDAEIIKNIIESNGSTVFIASSFEMAKQMTNALKFTALTVDVNLSENMTGPQMVEELRLVGAMAVDKPKVIVITGDQISSEELLDYMNRGFSDVLFKPIDPDRLLEALEV